MSGGGDSGESVLLKLTRMEGKLDLSNLRHDQTESRLRTVDERLHRHGNEITDIRAQLHVNEGERKGVAVSTKVMWVGMTAIAGGLLGIAALVLKVFGA